MISGYPSTSNLLCAEEEEEEASGRRQEEGSDANGDAILCHVPSQLLINIDRGSNSPLPQPAKQRVPYTRCAMAERLRGLRLQSIIIQGEWRCNNWRLLLCDETVRCTSRQNNDRNIAAKSKQCLRSKVWMVAKSSVCLKSSSCIKEPRCLSYLEEPRFLGKRKRSAAETT